MCRELSPGGRLACANPVCNGRSHVWVHESSAPDRKRDVDTRGRTARSARSARSRLGDVTGR